MAVCLGKKGGILSLKHTGGRERYTGEHREEQEDSRARKGGGEDSNAERLQGNQRTRKGRGRGKRGVSGGTGDNLKSFGGRWPDDTARSEGCKPTIQAEARKVSNFETAVALLGQRRQ